LSKLKQRHKESKAIGWDLIAGEELILN
jgi:hypothetical protein